MQRFEQNRVKEEQKEKNKMARLEKLINKIKERSEKLKNATNGDKQKETKFSVRKMMNKATYVRRFGDNKSGKRS